VYHKSPHKLPHNYFRLIRILIISIANHLMEQRGCPNLSISRWVGELDVDDSKFPGDAINSRNHYTTAPMVTNLCVHELASERRLALPNAMRTQARTKKQQSEYY
jgi:hypothetical protein